MILYKDKNKKREIIMKHYLKPENKKNLSEVEDIINIFSEECVDELKIKITFDKEKVEKVSWDGVGCAVFKASTDIFLNTIKNKTKKELKQITEDFEKLIHGKKDYVESLQKLNIFNNVHKQWNRLSCAKMIIRAIKEII